MIRACVTVLCLTGMLIGVPFAGPGLRAEPEAWMKKARPNELAFELIVTGDCPVDRAEFETIVLRTYNFMFMQRVPIVPGVPYLNIEIWCEQGAALLPFTVVARYEQINEPYAGARALGPGYDASGAVPFYRLRQQFEVIVREALNDHIAANFDL